MYLLLLIIALFFLLAISYYFFFNKDAATPAISFILGMLTCSSLLSIYYNRWAVNIHEETFLLVFGGCVSLVFGCIVMKILVGVRQIHGDVIFSPISAYRLKLILFLQIILALLQSYFLTRYYGRGSLSENLVAHTMALKFGLEEVMKLPFGVGFITGLTYYMAYIFAFLLPLYYKRRQIYREQFKLCLLNFVASLFISLLSSGRLGMLWMIVSFGTFYVITLQQSGKFINLKRIALFCVGAYIFLASFMFMGTLIGREYHNDESSTDIIIEYCGAEIQNLDDYIRGPIEKTEFFGEMTFNKYYKYLEKNFNLLKLSDRSANTLSFNQRRGYSLGNVYTAFQNYYIDFGFSGTMVVCFFIGGIMELLYLKVLQGNSMRSGLLTWKTYLYALVVPSMFMSFFSESFFQGFSSIGTHQFWMSYIILFYLFYGKLPWNKKKTI